MRLVDQLSLMTGGPSEDSAHFLLSTQDGLIDDPIGTRRGIAWLTFCFLSSLQADAVTMHNCFILSDVAELNISPEHRSPMQVMRVVVVLVAVVLVVVVVVPVVVVV